MVVEDLGVADLELVEEIGRGGFGVVYRARQAGVDRDVAVKLLAVHGLDPDARGRFERECRVLGALSDHPHIVTVHGSGVAPSGRPYLVMAYVAGGSLDDRLHRDGPLGWEEAVAIAVKLAGALETAHRAGILHRDIKPENVLVTDYGEPALADFGIARVAGETHTRTGHITATLVHAAPEVLDGQRPTERADVYSLASTTFTLIAGHAPFQPDTEGGIGQLVARVMTQAVPDLRGRAVPAEVCTVLEQAMAKAPEERPGALAFGEQLIGAQRTLGRPPTAIAVRPSPPASVAMSPAREPADDEPAEAVPAEAVPGATPPGDSTRVHVRSSGPGARPGSAERPNGPGPAPAAARAQDVEPGAGQRRGRRTIGSLAAVAVLLVAVVVTVSLWPADRGDSGEDRVLWTRAPVELGGAAQAIAASGGGVFALTGDELVAVDAAAGATAWSRAVASSGAAGDGLVAAAGDVVAAVTAGGVSAFHSRDGSNLPGPGAEGSPVAVRAVGDGLYAVFETALVALDGSGEVRWRLTGPEAPTPTVADDGLVLVVASATLAGVDVSTGETRWQQDLAAPPAGTAAGPGYDRFYAAAVSGDEVSVVAVEAASGSRAWQRFFRSSAAPAVRVASDDAVVVVATGAQIHALDAGGGEPRWTVPWPGALAYLDAAHGQVVALGDGRVQTHDLYSGEVRCAGAAPEPAWPPLFDGRLYIPSAAGALHVLEDCEEVWRHQLPAGLRYAAPLFVDPDFGQGYVLADDGSITALRLWDG